WTPCRAMSISSWSREHPSTPWRRHGRRGRLRRGEWADTWACAGSYGKHAGQGVDPRNGTEFAEPGRAGRKRDRTDRHEFWQDYTGASVIRAAGRQPATDRSRYAQGSVSAVTLAGTWMNRRSFLLGSPPRRSDRWLACAAVAVSLLVFAATAPFARVPLAEIWGFVPSYQSALAINDLITSILLYALFQTVRARELLLLAAGYLFTALMAIVHARPFPVLFAPAGLLAAAPQTT